MALALSEGGLYLNGFDALRPTRVGMMSGESGAATIQETALRVAASKGKKLEVCGVCGLGNGRERPPAIDPGCLVRCL
jgi:hypothetical protein